MKTVEVPDNWCEDCRGKGTRTLHGEAIPMFEFQEWDAEEREAYLSGEYDTICETCGGSGEVDPEEAAEKHEAEAMLRMEAPHLFQ